VLYDRTCGTPRGERYVSDGQAKFTDGSVPYPSSRKNGRPCLFVKMLNDF
jgi:hypothetical protein